MIAVLADSEKPCAVIVSGNPRSRRFIVTALNAAGLRVLEATTPEQGVLVASIAAPEVPLVYVVDGSAATTVERIEVTCRAIRARSRAPIIAMIDPRRHDEHRPAFVDGADHCVARPRHMREMAARVLSFVEYASRAAPRDERILANLEERAQRRDVRGAFAAAGLIIDFDYRSIRRDGRRLPVSRTEWRILEALARAVGKPVSRERVLSEVWAGLPSARAESRLRVHLTYLRRKLEPVSGAPRVILTEPGYGYRFVAEPVLVRDPTDPEAERRNEAEAHATTAHLLRPKAGTESEEAQHARIHVERRTVRAAALADETDE